MTGTIPEYLPPDKRYWRCPECFRLVSQNVVSIEQPDTICRHNNGNYVMEMLVVVPQWKYILYQKNHTCNCDDGCKS